MPGALALAGTAGYINSVVLGFFHTPVSHMTGAVSRLGLDAAAGETNDVRASLAIIIGFVSGAMAGGMMVGAQKLVPSRRYGAAMVTEGVLVGVAMWLLLLRHRLGLPTIAMACGLQNSVSSSYCGLAIRTTHVTGLVTDVGVMLGHWLRHRRVDWAKLRFLVLLFLAFGAGGWLGAVFDLHFGPAALAIPAGGCVVAGTIFWWLANRGALRLPARAKARAEV
ncbi:MAG TPA: YoaK family protein [Opitutaceae bacterium]